MNDERRNQEGWNGGGMSQCFEGNGGAKAAQSRLIYSPRRHGPNFYNDLSEFLLEELLISSLSLWQGVWLSLSISLSFSLSLAAAMRTSTLVQATQSRPGPYPKASQRRVASALSLPSGSLHSNTQKGPHFLRSSSPGTGEWQGM